MCDDPWAENQKTIALSFLVNPRRPKERGHIRTVCYLFILTMNCHPCVLYGCSTPAISMTWQKPQLFEFTLAVGLSCSYSPFPLVSPRICTISGNEDDNRSSGSVPIWGCDRQGHRRGAEQSIRLYPDFDDGIASSGPAERWPSSRPQVRFPILPSDNRAVLLSIDPRVARERAETCRRQRSGDSNEVEAGRCASRCVAKASASILLLFFQGIPIPPCLPKSDSSASVSG